MARRKSRNKPGLRKAGKLREKVQLGHSEVGRVCELGIRNKDVWINHGNGAFGLLGSMIEPWGRNP